MKSVKIAEEFVDARCFLMDNVEQGFAVLLGGTLFHDDFGRADDCRQGGADFVNQKVDVFV